MLFSLRDKSLLALRGDDKIPVRDARPNSFTHERFAKTTRDDFSRELGKRHAMHFLERAESMRKLMESPMAGALKEPRGLGSAGCTQKTIDFCVAREDLVSAIRLFLATTDLLGRGARFREQMEKGDAILHAFARAPRRHGGGE